MELKNSWRAAQWVETVRNFVKLGVYIIDENLFPINSGVSKRVSEQVTEWAQHSARAQQGVRE